MFMKRESEADNSKIEKENEGIGYHSKEMIAREPMEPVARKRVNTILKGSRLKGDINVSYDLELDGIVEGNITSDTDSNIIIRGSCNGSIRTKGGNVNIESEMINGDIFAGGDVRITGKFTGGKVEAKGKIYISGEFSGKLESSEIEIGPQAKGKGELVYKEFISIERGAKVEANITRAPGEQNEAKKPFKAVDNKNGGKKESNPDPVQQLIMYSN
ncbi:MAG: bactofilin family protein [bacterium]